MTDNLKVYDSPIVMEFKPSELKAFEDELHTVATVGVDLIVRDFITEHIGRKDAEKLVKWYAIYRSEH